MPPTKLQVCPPKDNPNLLVHFAPALVCAVLFATNAEATDSKWSLSIGGEYSTGDYGSADSTDIWIVPLSAKYKSDAWSVRLSTSWLHITGPGGVTPEGETVGGAGARRTVQGMGDITTTLTWAAMGGRDAPFNLDLGAKVKFGTADEDKSLGTGKNDYALFGEISHPMGDWYPFVKLGYSWRGDPDGADYRNVWYGNLGLDYRISKTVSTGFYYDWRQQLTATGSEVSEATAYLNLRLNAQNKLNLYAGSGFSDASPQLSVGMMLSHTF